MSETCEDKDWEFSDSDEEKTAPTGKLIEEVQKDETKAIHNSITPSQIETGGSFGNPRSNKFEPLPNRQSGGSWKNSDQRRGKFSKDRRDNWKNRKYEKEYTEPIVVEEKFEPEKMGSWPSNFY